MRESNEEGNNMNKILQSIIVAAGLAVVAVSPAMAQTFSANITGTTNYMWRGISQSSNDPALQGGLDYDFGNGLAVGTWASTVDFGDDTSLEWDIYGSYTTSLTENLGATFGVIGYVYPDAPGSADSDFVEFYAGPNFTLGIASVTGRLYYSPEFGSRLSSIYWTGGISIPFAGILSASANVGYSDSDSGIGDYTDWNIGLAASYEFLTLTGMVVGNDLPGSKERFVGMLTAKFSVP